MNSNQKLIDGLREAADWLEAHPDFPDLTYGYGQPRVHAIRLWLQEKSALQSVARKLGSFTKRFSDRYFELHKAFGPHVEIEVNISREELGCKKVITWDCPDESILKLTEPEESHV